MQQLPSTLAFLDENMRESGTLRRLGPQDVFQGARVCEADYDKVIVGQLTFVADCLREAGLLGEGHDLLHIGDQIENIDVLCAEVEQQSKVFQRFVVIEDKLCRNPEGRLAVLGQIIDYSKKLHELIGAEVEFGDASAKARIYNSSTRRPATLFVVTGEAPSTCARSTAGSRRLLWNRNCPPGTCRN
jgi:hypothetical protein